VRRRPRALSRAARARLDADRSRARRSNLASSVARGDRTSRRVSTRGALSSFACSECPNDALFAHANARARLDRRRFWPPAAAPPHTDALDAPHALAPMAPSKKGGKPAGAVVAAHDEDDLIQARRDARRDRAKRRDG